MQPNQESSTMFSPPSVKSDKNSARKISLPILAGIIRTIDAISIVTAGLIAFSIYSPINQTIQIQVYISPILLAVIFQQNISSIMGAYQDETIVVSTQQVRWITFSWCATFALILVVAFGMKSSSDYSRVWAISWFGSTLAFFLISRLLLHAATKKWIRTKRLTRNVIVVGMDQGGQSAISYLNSVDGRYQVLGYFDDRKDRIPERIMDVRLLGPVSSLLEFSRKNHVDLVLIALPWSAEERIFEITKQLKELPVEIRLCPPTISTRLLVLGYSDVAGMPTLNLHERPLNDYQILVKSLQDRFISLTLLLFLAPLMILIAAIVKLETPGSITFRQPRFGFNGELIEVYKFRTMHADMADTRAESLTLRNDPRVTSFGHFLRKSSLDELPQLFNVLKGDMSLVGPRPHPIAAKAANRLYSNVVEDYASRHRIKPGITGWAQVNGWRGNTDTEEKLRKRVEHDLYYIEHWSVWFDIKIIFMTIFVLFFNNKNAY